MARTSMPCGRPGGPSGCGGFTVWELLAILVVLGVVGLVLLPAFVTTTRRNPRQLRDGTQVRSLVQGLHLWAQNNDDKYPLPSELDVDGWTVAADSAFEKDTTGNIYSVLVFNSFAPTEIFVSPNESNTDGIREYENYELDEPTAAVDPLRALWDPRFRSSPRQVVRDFDIEADASGGFGNSSYAHLPVFGQRRARWMNTFGASEAVLGNRGPEYVGQAGAWTFRRGRTGRESNTLAMHGERDVWAGNIGYNDAHVEFETRPDPEGVRFGPEKAWRDNLFVNEDDGTGEVSSDLDQMNALLRIVDAVTGTRGVDGEEEVMIREADLWVD